MIELIHMKKAYDNITPLKDVNAVINEGDIISVIGPSGTGKSTLLRCINLIERPTEGQILFNGEDITAPGCDVNRVRRRMGMVFQSFNLFGHLTVIENIMLAPTRLLKISRQEAYDQGIALLRKVGLVDKALSYPDELSGGQKQRVAIARTLAMDPEVILLDEPTSALDPTMVGEVEAVIRDLSTSGKTLMIVTHEMRFARSICNRVFYMDEGGIYDDGTPEEIFEHPVKENTRRFIRQLKILEFTIENRSFDYLGKGAEIDLYCSRHQIQPKLANRIRYSIEEMVQIILLTQLSAPKIHVVVEYSEKTEKAIVTVRYNGPDFDPAASEDLMAWTILQGSVRSISHTTIREEGYTNKVMMEVGRVQ